MGREKPKKASGSRRGFSLLELVIAMAVIALAILSLMTLINSSAHLQEISREKALATNAVRKILEEMRNAVFSEVYARYNSNGADNPVGSASSGHTFSVAGLNPVVSGGLVGQIFFPEVGTSLCENVQNATLGMAAGKDLNRDGVIDGNPRNTDYKVLPVRVVILWRGVGNLPTQVEVSTFITEK
jgi:prepilin-type N-terminal cleavage/methylation domain-containing protein